MLSVIVCLLLSSNLPAEEVGRAPDLSAASWIWSAEATAADAGPVCYFRYKLQLDAEPAEATIALTADNGYELWVNNEQVAAEVDYGGSWRTVERFRVEDRLISGANVIAIRGENLGGPGGLLAAAFVRCADGSELSIPSNQQWLTTTEPDGNWPEPDHDDSVWTPAKVVAKYGAAPWGKLTIPNALTDPKSLVVDRRLPGGAAPMTEDRYTEPSEDFVWPKSIVYLSGRAPLHSTKAQTTKWPIRGSRAFFEYDTPAPAMSGYRLYALSPATPAGTPRLLLDAGRGLIASPTCSFDGREILFCMAPEGEKFFHLYRMAADGSGLTKLTEGPWHDYDPVHLPDGRIAFASTRIGSREEYHANTARSLFVLETDRETIRPLTYHIVADSEPEVMADGRIAFVRQDNFLERAKVETHIHCIRPDGSGGEVLIGPDREEIGYDPAVAAEDGYQWLRNYGAGSPAPLPDGRVACITHLGPTITEMSEEGRDIRAMPCDVNPFDMAPTPDGRLLVSTIRGALALVDPNTGEAVKILETEARDLHSVAYVGPRPRPRGMSTIVHGERDSSADNTGLLLCQSVFNTKQVKGEWGRVTGIRVYTGNPLTLRAAHHQYVHIGTDGIELGTVPLAPDGSFYARVPADRSLALQAVDAEGRPVVNELSWIYVRPGETRSCIGCHAPRQTTPTEELPLAATAEPVELLLKGDLPRFRANNAANGGVLNLQLDRFREAASIDLYRQAPLASGVESASLAPSRRAEVERLLRLLKQGAAHDRRAAAHRLGIFRDRAAVPGLCLALKDDDRAVRTAAAVSLAACGNRKAVAELLDALDDRAPEVAQACAAALRHLTGHAEPFNAYGTPVGRARQAGVWRRWIAANDWDAIERALIRRVDDPDATVSHLALEALGHLGGVRARETLRAYVESDGRGNLPARLAAIRALGHLRDEAAAPLLACVLEENTRKAEVKPAKSHEFGWAAAPDHLAGAAAEALGWIGTTEAEARLLEAFGKLVEFWYYSFRSADHTWLMGCHSSLPHYRILEALEAIGSRRAGDLTARLLQSVPMDPDRGLLFENDSYEVLTARLIYRNGRSRPVVETCLAVLGDAQATPTESLRQAVTASPPAVSVGPLSAESRAAHLLSVVALDPESAPRVLAAFERFRAMPASRKRSWVCFFLARTLGKLGHQGAVPVLRAALDDDPNEASHGIPDPPNVFLHNAMTPLYRAAAADALGRIGDKSGVPSLLAAVSDYGNAMDVRHAAARALGMIADPSSREQLRQLAEGYPEVVTRVALQQAYAGLASQ